MIRTERMQIRELLAEAYGYHCHYCLQPIHPRSTNASIDHVVPVSKGGQDVWENIVLACKDCNEKKSNLNAEDFNLVRRLL